MGHLPFAFLKVAIFLPVPVSRKQQRQIEARRSRSRDDFEIAGCARVAARPNRDSARFCGGFTCHEAGISSY
jgi:hypothetical protein